MRRLFILDWQQRIIRLMAKLRAPRERVEKMLLEHIRVGEDVNSNVKVAEKTGGYDDWLRLLDVWRKETITDLKAAYEEKDIAFEFEAVTGTTDYSTPRYTFEHAKTKVSYGIKKLEDLIERLQLALPESKGAPGIPEAVEKSSKAVFSNKSLGLVRDLLRNMQPQEAFSQYETNQFWQDTLFDTGFSQDSIDFAKKYGFNWSHIIPYVSKARFDRNSYSSEFGPLGSSELLEQLTSFVLNIHKDSGEAEELRQSLVEDGFPLDSESHADSTLPQELAELPNQKKLEMDLAKIFSEHKNVALLFADCDGFKAVNDTLGHQEGDQCLVRAVQTIGAAILGKGAIYRYGGDEFVVILPNFDLEEAAATAERIRKAIERDRPGGDLEVTLSIGVANSQTQNTEDANELIRAADMAMYKAKKTKNSVSYFE